MALLDKARRRRFFSYTIRRQFLTIVVSMSSMSLILMIYQYKVRQESQLLTDATHQLIYEQNGRSGNLVKENGRSVKLPENNQFMVMQEIEQLAAMNKVEEEKHSLETNRTKIISKDRNGPLEGVVAQLDSEDPMEGIVRQHFQIGNRIKFDYQHPYIINGSTICKDVQTPVLLIMCLSNPGEHTTRHIIRTTWSSITRTGRWPMSAQTYTSEVKIVFLIGKPWTRDVGKRIARESATYKDVIVSDFNDKYTNLTRKVLVGLQWARQYCPGFKFVMKTDSDTFVHVKNAIDYVKTVEPGNSGVVIGSTISKAAPFRRGKWALSEENYPFTRFPFYTSGQTYIISNNLALKIVDTAKYFSYIRIEDVFITGIMRVVLGGRLIDLGNAFPRHARIYPSTCEFFGVKKISETNINDEMKYIIWDLLQKPRQWCKN
ncbi:Beta-1 [Mactra antiquata]